MSKIFAGARLSQLHEGDRWTVVQIAVPGSLSPGLHGLSFSCASRPLVWMTYPAGGF